ncbi:AAA family ATPase [Bradyrhizobium sp. USDA 4529]
MTVTATKPKRDKKDFDAAKEAAEAAKKAAEAAKKAEIEERQPKLRKLTVTLATQKARPWVARGYGMRGSVTLFVGAGGASKTQFLLQCAFMFALGLTYAGFTPMRRLRIMIVSGEEDSDEIRLRLEAVAHWYITSEFKDEAGCVTKAAEKFTENTLAALMAKLDGYLWEYVPGNGELDVGPLVMMGDKDTPQTTPFHEQMKRDVKECKADIVIFDPLINFHEGLKESDSVHMQALNKAARQIGRAGNCNVTLAQHATKALSRTADADANATRGSSALHAGARVQKGMTEMSEDEGEKYFRDPEAHLDYVLLGDPKQSYQKKKKHSLILRRVSIPLDTLLENKEQDYGYALEVANLRPLAEDVLNAPWLQEFLETIDAAYKSADQYQMAYSTAITGKSDRKARDLLVANGWTQEAQAKRTLEKLVQIGLIAEVEIADGRGHQRKVYRAIPQGKI